MNEHFAANLSIVNYALLTVLWGTILGLYLRYRRIARGEDALVAVLASVLALDAFKSAIESLFFGLLWAGNYGVGSAALSRLLSRPAVLTLPKLLNTVVALVVLAVVVRRWIPSELRERRERLEQAELLRRELVASLAETAAKEERWQLALQANKDAIWDWSSAGDAVWISPRYEQQLGYGPGELAGSMTRATFEGLLHPEDRDATLASFARFLDGHDASYQAEFRLRTRAGGYRRILSRAFAVRDPAGRATRVVGSHADVTEQRDAEAALAARQRTESLGLLAGGIAHDFNNLLAVMRTNASVARDRVGDADRGDAAGAFDDLETALARASDLTARLLAYSGRGRFVVRALDLSEMGREMARMLGSSAPPNVHIESDFQSDLPAVEADAAQMQQLWLNLFTNAVDAIGPAPGAVRMRTRVEEIAEPLAPVCAGEPALPPGRYVVLEVEDTGAGMTAETRARMFEPFFTTKARGRGLGTSAMLGILRGHRAGMRLRSEPGRGTTFTVLFPCADVAATAAAAAAGARAGGGARSESAAGARAPEGARRILVAEDEPLLRRALARALEDLGFAIDVAANGREAIEKLDAAPARYNLLLVDLTMPEVDGRAVIAHARERWPGTPVILMSGYAEEASQGDADTYFLHKPFEASALEKCVREVAR